MLWLYQTYRYITRYQHILLPAPDTIRDYLMTTTADINDPTSSIYQIKEKMAILEDAVTNRLPNLATILRDIHKHLKADAECVTLLSEEDCAILVSGLKIQTGVSIATKALAKKSGRKAMSKITTDDL